MDSGNRVIVDIGEIENTCFVIMPFDALFQTQYERVIRPAVEELGLKCVRGDEIYSKQQIMADIWKSIRKARLIIAELTTRNANVFYEVGLAHSIGKPIILLTRNEDDVPFDLKSLRYRYYNTNDPFWGENLRDAIQTMIGNVLAQPEMPQCLEGIISEIELPKPPHKGDVTPQEVGQIIDISGNWKVDIKGGTKQKEPVILQGIIFITQYNEQLSATMTISSNLVGAMTVVQEVLTGTIHDNQISLEGVSYTFVHQGNAKEYALDGFKLNLNADGSRMDGEFLDRLATGQVIFIKQEAITQ